MFINEELLLKYDAEYVSYGFRNDIFKKGDTVRHYLQIKSGTVELCNYHEDGKEFTLNILDEGQSVGESFLFSENHYPMFAVAKTDCDILRLEKSKFLQLLNENPPEIDNLLKHLSDRLFHKYLMLFNNSSSDAGNKIKSLLDYYKEISTSKNRFEYEVPFTRQQIANLTGLRVETVIRVVKKLERDKVLKIMDHAIFY